MSLKINSHQLQLLCILMLSPPVLAVAETQSVDPQSIKTLSNTITTTNASTVNRLELDHIRQLPPAEFKQKVLVADYAIASWYKDSIITAKVNPNKKPVIVITSGWSDGISPMKVNANSPLFLSREFAKAGYIALEIGFAKDPTQATWNSDLLKRVQKGLDDLCRDSTIPANCGAIVLVGSSYSGKMINGTLNHLVSNGYNTTNKRILGVVSQHAGYGNWSTINNQTYSVAMIQNITDPYFKDEQAHAQDRAKAYGKTAPNVYSWCPSYGGHGANGTDGKWQSWVLGVTRHIIRTRNPQALSLVQTQPLSKAYTNSCA